VRQAVFPLGYLPTQLLDAPQPFGAYTQNDEHKGRWVMASVSSYCPCALCCGTHDKITANGASTDAMPYNFAADRSLPFGTHISVPLGLGVLDGVRRKERTFIVDDRGGALDTEARKYGILRLDLRVQDHWYAVKFGRKQLPVYISIN
jgi:3D (Asp-Asp-Asp) domain-containing protein